MVEYWGGLTKAALTSAFELFPISIPLLSIAAISFYRKRLVEKSEVRRIILLALVQAPWLFLLTGIGTWFRNPSYYPQSDPYNRAAAHALQAVWVGTFLIMLLAIWRFRNTRWFAFGLLGFVQFLLSIGYLVSAMSITGNWI